MDRLTFKHQDGDLTFEIAGAMFEMNADNQLTISILCNGNPQYSWMSNPRFCLVDFPLPRAIKAGDAIEFGGSEEGIDEGPRCYAYSGEHCSPTDIVIKFKRVSKDEYDVDLSWLQGDPNYYDGRAKPTAVKTSCTLRRAPREHMWIPA